MNPRLTLTLLLAVSSLARAQPAQPPATQEELEGMLADKKYPEVLKEAARVLGLKGTAAGKYDRCKVFMIRGEAALQLKQQTLAVDSFASAAREGTDAMDIAVARTSEALIRKSRGFVYTPKASKERGKVQPIELLDVEKRKDAFAALFEDEWTAAGGKVEALKRKQGLSSIMEAVKLVATVAPFEQAATGSVTQTRKSLTELGDSARTQMEDFLTQQSKRVDEISKQANRKIKRDDGYDLQGLDSRMVADLKDVIATCLKIAPAARELADATGVDGAKFSSVVTDAEQLGKRADETLNADYTGYRDRSGARPR